MEEKNCTHEWIVEGGKNVCRLCKKSYLVLKDTNTDGIKVGTKVDGKNYSVRTSRLRYFFPVEWDEFTSKLAERNKFVFETLLITGGRIHEVMMIRKRHIFIDNKYLILYTTKVKAKKQERTSKQREITLPKSYIRQLKTYIEGMQDDDYIFLDNKKLVSLTMEQINSVADKRGLNIYQIFKRALNKTSIKDTYNFSLHNIRKTTGMWLKAMNVKMEEICFRLGHDMNTYLKHYGSTDRFELKDRQYIQAKFSGTYGM